MPFGELAGVRITELTADRAVAEFPRRPEVMNQVGTVHAAALYLAANFAGAVATDLPLDRRVPHGRTGRCFSGA
ncbi:MAG: PaaI family thioesterase [Trebonia sp.]